MSIHISPPNTLWLVISVFGLILGFANMLKRPTAMRAVLLAGNALVTGYFTCRVLW